MTTLLVPAILSDLLIAVAVDLVIDENAAPSITRVPNDTTYIQPLGNRGSLKISTNGRTHVLDLGCRCRNWNLT